VRTQYSTVGKDLYYWLTDKSTHWIIYHVRSMPVDSIRACAQALLQKLWKLWIRLLQATILELMRFCAGFARSAMEPMDESVVRAVKHGFRQAEIPCISPQSTTTDALYIRFYSISSSHEHKHEHGNLVCYCRAVLVPYLRYHWGLYSA